MNKLYLECYSGISGDMFVASLIDLGASVEVLENALKSIPIQGFETKITRVSKSDIDAVPTSIGYGANMHGISSLLTMINSCANGIATVNIDNGYGAGYIATQINRLGVRSYE